MSWETLRPHIHQKWKLYWYQTHPPHIADPSWRYLFSGGKEIRARLFCELWSYLSPDGEPCGELAFAIECIHAASLILDDTPWMDNATTRRGKPTLHLTLSNKKSLMIFHDVMYMVYLLWNENKPLHVSESDWNRIILYHLQRLMVGQIYDLDKKGTLVELASMKTGVLFEMVTEIVAVCTDLDRNAWRLWGNHLGILFQWMDDWQDREEDTIQQNRNAFNESYDSTLECYGKIWLKLEQTIGPSWFRRPFGIFMITYFTSDIPLPIIPPNDLSLSHLFHPYPISTLPEIEEKSVSITLESDRIIRNIRINRQNIFDLDRSDIGQLLQSKQPIEIMMNDQIQSQNDLDDLFHLSCLQWAQSFNESNISNMNGKRIIQIMLQLAKQLERSSDKKELYHDQYKLWKQKIWTIEETEWEYQPELINFIYDEIQSMKNRQID
jgi:hypothetical protein